MDPLPIVVKVRMEGEQLGQRVRITAQVEGEGEAARAAAVELPAALASALASALARPAAPPEARAEAPPAIAAAAPAASTTAAPPAAATAAPAVASAPAPALPPAAPAGWVTRHRARLNLGLGGLLLALAMLIPMLVPADQRREVLVMTILFGLTGALLLFTAGLPSRSRAALRATPLGASSTAGAPTSQPAPPKRAPSGGRAQTALSSGSSPAKSWSGIAVGLAFVLAGLLAPFTLGATTADERFLIMLGFAPISVIGFFLIAIFWRNLPWRAAAVRTDGAPMPAAVARPPSGAAAATASRRPASRVPDNVMFRGVIPIAIGALVVILVAVVIVLVVAALASTGR